MLGDLLARLPGIGRMLRDNGITTVSLLWLLVDRHCFSGRASKSVQLPTCGKMIFRHPRLDIWR